ncbi:hypothetical protein BN1723_008326 [Verticillium longisporum]|uniref:AMP-dependent synthetase/ligase domain-containing protein n=1 Tax=Verticillium longisporum TaxID=100787 RepID=A0A0G4NRN1_VERLO|nr:hypothetical protein BN1723_008326 [Verticillium longisporum]
MVFTSPFPSLDIPKTNLLTYLFPEDQLPQEDPLWLDCKDDRINLSPKELVEWVKRLSFGLERIGVKRGDVVLICTPNQIFVPVAYLGIVGAGCIFSGANPAYTIPELVHQLNNTTAKVILAHPDHLDHMPPPAMAFPTGVPSSAPPPKSSTLHYIEALKEVRFDDLDIVHAGNRFAWLGNGYSQTELDNSADWAFYIRNRDDDAPLTTGGRRKVLSKSGTVKSRDIVVFSGKRDEAEVQKETARL